MNNKNILNDTISFSITTIYSLITETNDFNYCKLSIKDFPKVENVLGCPE